MSEIIVCLLRPDVVNSAGLVLDIGGVVILFCYGLPAEIRKEHLLSVGENEKQVRKWNHYKRISRLGLGLLVLGFSLQLVSNWL